MTKPSPSVSGTGGFMAQRGGCWSTGLCADGENVGQASVVL